MQKLIWIGLGMLAMGCTGGVEAPAKTEGPAGLACEHAMNPLGIDEKAPVLSWKLRDARRGAAQKAYQVVVASSPELLSRDRGDLWDSGRVDSDGSIQVAYAGKAPASRQRCHWKVRVWDQDGQVSAWSGPAWWEMGLLEVSDWGAKWISPAGLGIVEKPIAVSKWVNVGKPGGKGVILARAEIDGGVQPHSASVAVGASGPYEVFINGKSIGKGGDTSKIVWYSANGVPKEGRNIVAVKLAAGPGQPRLAMGLRVTRFGGDTFETLPGGWRFSEKSADGWMKPDFNAGAWAKAKETNEPPALAQEFDGPRRSHFLRREFDLPSPPVRARAYVTGLGLFELTVNGKKAGTEVFDPGWTQYEKRIQYRVFDITELLKAGPNAAGVVLGNGWWSSGLGWSGGQRHAKPGENLRFLGRIEIECGDGSRHTIVSDTSWTAKPSPILADTLYHGETYDARQEQPGWDVPGAAADGWTPAVVTGDADARLCAHQGPPLRVVEELEAAAITEPKPGIWVLDFGQNHPGRPRLTVQAPSGTTVAIRHAELLGPDGLIDNVNYRSARVTDTYVCKGGGVETWEPRFTYRGYRYAQVTGLPEAPSKQTLVSRVLHTDAPMAGTFECSDPLVNRIVQNARWGLRSNLHSVPTDCPQRDERLGWMGDSQAFAPTSLWLMDLDSLYGKWTRDMRDAQRADGAVPGVCPVIVLKPDSDGRAAWADAIAIVPWQVYRYTGDKKILAENYEGVRRWAEYIRAHLTGGLYEEETWGDWVPVVKTPYEPVSAAFGFYSTHLVARMAEVLGRTDDARTYGQLAEQMAAAYNAKYLLPGGGYSAGTQSAQVLPLAFGITPPDRRGAVARILADDVEKTGHHTTGFLGTPLILPVLADSGHAGLAWKIMSSTEYPSLGYMVKQGATTVWERWNSDQEGPGMNSRNHFALGAMVQWLFEGVAGMRPDDARPGFKHVLVEPYVVDGLQWARAEHDTPYGTLACRWDREGEGLRLKLTVPPNTTATVRLPKLGHERVSVTEGGAPAGGVKDAGDRVEVDVAAGTYDFAVVP